MKTLILGALLISNAYGGTLKIEAKTDKGYASWFMPTSLNGVSVNRIGATTCTTTTKGKAFQLICETVAGKILIYQDETPRRDAIVATPGIVIKIVTMEKK